MGSVGFYVEVILKGNVAHGAPTYPQANGNLEASVREMPAKRIQIGDFRLQIETLTVLTFNLKS
jgi:hypothetical protein